MSSADQPAPATEPAPDEVAPPDADGAPVDGSPPPGADADADADEPSTDTDDAADADAAESMADDAAPDPQEGDDAGDASPLDVLAATERERDEYLDRLQRLQADFENYKKRMQRQQTETLERAGEGLATKLLPVLDTIDLARQHGAGEGVEQIANALADVLSKEGLERIDPVGQAFDPNEHEAVSHEPADDAEEPSVSGLLRAGYRWKGRLVRPAMVTVRG